MLNLVCQAVRRSWAVGVTWAASLADIILLQASAVIRLLMNGILLHVNRAAWAKIRKSCPGKEGQSCCSKVACVNK